MSCTTGSAGTEPTLLKVLPPDVKVSAFSATVAPKMLEPTTKLEGGSTNPE